MGRSKHTRRQRVRRLGGTTDGLWRLTVPRPVAGTQSRHQVVTVNAAETVGINAVGTVSTSHAESTNKLAGLPGGDHVDSRHGRGQLMQHSDNNHVDQCG